MFDKAILIDHLFESFVSGFVVVLMVDFRRTVTVALSGVDIMQCVL